MKNSSRIRLAGVVAFALFISTVGSMFLQTASAATCSGTAVAPGSSIQTAIDSHGVNTTFCLASGTFSVNSSIRPKSGDTFIGIGSSRDGVIVRTSSAQIIFETDNTTGVTFRHFAITGAVNACPGHNCGETGRAISRGTNVSVDDMHLYANGQNGIGGTSSGLMVTNSEIDHNGAQVADGVSAGIKTVHTMTVTDSWIHDNKNNGVWCDISCGAYTVTGNTVTGNTGNGIFMEISQGAAVLANNTVKDNNTSSKGGHGGISVVSSKNANVYGNTLGGNHGFGIAAHQDNRINCGSPSSTCGYLLSNISIHDNALVGDVLTGCNVSGVDCKQN